MRPNQRTTGIYKDKLTPYTQIGLHMSFPFGRPRTHGLQELAYLRTGEAPAPASDYWCYKVGVKTRTQALARSGYWLSLLSLDVGRCWSLPSFIFSEALYRSIVSFIVGHVRDSR
jgi:hypothetical protein